MICIIPAPGAQEQQGHGTGQVRDTLTGLINIQLIKEAVDAVGQTQLEQTVEGSFNPMLIIKQISVRTRCRTHRPGSQKHTSRSQHSFQPNSFPKQRIRAWAKQSGGS